MPARIGLKSIAAASGSASASVALGPLPIRRLKRRQSMAVDYHPKQGSVVAVNFETGFVPPEMVKLRLAVVLSPAIRQRVGLCTVVPLSTTPPEKTMPYHCKLAVSFRLPPKWGDGERWVKGDMVYAVSLRRVDLLRLGKDANGKRIYQTEVLPPDDFQRVRRCVLHGLGLSNLTKHL